MDDIRRRRTSYFYIVFLLRQSVWREVNAGINWLLFKHCRAAFLLLFIWPFYFIYSGILAGFLLITILSTIYDLIYIKYRRKSNLLLSSFSLITNWKLLLSEPMNPDEIKPLHGIRALAICWIVMGHSVIYPLRGPTMNFLDQPKVRKYTSTWQPVTPVLLKSIL